MHTAHPSVSIEEFSKMLKTNDNNALFAALRQIKNSVDAQNVRSAYAKLRLLALDGGWS